MKMAQALNLRSDIQNRMTELEDRLAANARMQEGVAPAEDPIKLFDEYEACAVRLEELMAKINHTNNTTTVGDMTLTDLLAKRDCLKLRVRMYQRFLREASAIGGRAMRSEIRILSTVPVADYRKKLDECSEELRRVDGIIQEANWTTELV